MNSTDIARQVRQHLSNQLKFLIVDTESVPDGRLLGKVKYPDLHLSPEEAIDRARAEFRERSQNGSDFIPVTFQYPVAVCVLRLDDRYRPEALTCLDAPQFRPGDIVKQFWDGLGRYRRAKLVTLNGRVFDMPLLELAMFRYGRSAPDYFLGSRKRFDSNHEDLLDWLTNYGACRLAGGLDLLAKMLGKPGKMEVSGDQVYEMYKAGKLQEINDYCMFDTLDTYFVFLRTRVMKGELTLEQEHQLVHDGREWLAAKAPEVPALKQYLDNWGDWEPWP